MLARLKGWLRQRLLIRWRRIGLYEVLVGLENRLFGRRLRIESCSACQLACPSCATANGETKTGAVGWGRLRATEFERMLDGAGRIRSLELSNWGEVMLNTELPAILAIAARRRVPVTLLNGVNLNDASDGHLQALVTHGVRAISVSIDGASRESYARYRINGDFDRVIGNLDRLVAFKRAAGASHPVLIWQFIVFQHNVDELPTAARMARERDMIFKPIANLDPTFSPVENPDALRRTWGIEFDPGSQSTLAQLGDSLAMCNQMWDAPQINWDGRLLGCCMNNWGDYGNVLDAGLDAALADPRYAYAKRMLLGLESERADIPCSRCDIYRAMFPAAPKPIRLMDRTPDSTAG